MGKRAKEKVSSSFDQFFSSRFSADKTGDQGLWCGNCRKRRKWKELRATYGSDKRTGEIYRQWYCTCGDMLREDDISDMGEAQAAGQGSSRTAKPARESEW